MGTEHHSQADRRRRVAVALIVFAAVVIFYVASIPGVFILNPDSALYMGLGRSLAQGKGYAINGESYGKFPPLFPAMLSVVYATVGESFWWLQFVPALCGVVGVVLVFWVLRPRIAWWPALAVAVLTATNMFYESHSLLVVRSDVPYTCFSLAALGLAERQIRSERVRLLAWLGVALVVVAAIYVHMNGLALVPAVAGAALIAKRQRAPVTRRLMAAALVGVLAAGAAGYWLWRGAQLERGATYADHVAMVKGEEHKELLLKLRLRPREWTATPLNLRYTDMTWYDEDEGEAFGPAAWLGLSMVPADVLPGLLLLGLLLVPGYVQAVGRHRNALEIYLPTYFVLSTLAGGPGGHERYVIPVVPLLLTYGYLSVKLGERGLRWWVNRRDEPGLVMRHLPHGFTLAVFILLFGQNIYTRAKARGGLEKFDDSNLARQERIAAAWRRMGVWIDEHLPAEARIYPGSGGAWGRGIYFIPRKLILPWLSDFDQWLLKRMLDEGATHVLKDPHPRSRERLAHTLWEHEDDLYTSLYSNNKLTLYALDRAELARVVAKLEAEGAFETSRGQVAAEHRMLD